MKNILVIGESCIDVTHFGECQRICPEAPVPIFNLKDGKQSPGMAANVVRNINNINRKLNVKLLTSQQMPIKRRFVDKTSKQLMLRVDENDSVNEILTFTKETLDVLEWADIVVVSDYNKGLLTTDFLKRVSEYCLKNNKPSFIDTKKNGGDWAKDFSFIKINEKEFTNWDGVDKDVVNKIIVTLGARGCMFQGEEFQTKQVEVRDVTGAGDTFLAALVVLYSEKQPITKCIEFAQNCCGLVVQKNGVAMPYDD